MPTVRPSTWHLIGLGRNRFTFFWEKADFTEEKFGRVSRAYIYCAQDKAIGPALQREMVEATPCDPVFTLDSVHSPFLTAPDALAQILLSLGE